MSEKGITSVDAVAHSVLKKGLASEGPVTHFGFTACRLNVLGRNFRRTVGNKATCVNVSRLIYF